MPHSFAKLALPLVAVLPLMASGPAWPQDEADEAAGADEPAPAEDSGEGTPGVETGEAPSDEGAADEDGGGPAVGLDEIPELDEQTYEKDDDEFIPTEEIPVDQSIPFPTDI